MIDTTRPEGQLIFGVFASFSEFKRELVRKRTRAGMAAAKRRGKRFVCPAWLDPDELDVIASTEAVEFWSRGRRAEPHA